MASRIIWSIKCVTLRSDTSSWRDRGRPDTHWDLDAERGQGPRRHSVHRQPRLPKSLLEDPRMKQKLAMPAFKSEAEEAEWWYKNRTRLDKDLVEAAKKGKLKRLDRAT